MLIRVNRLTQKPEPELAASWIVSKDSTKITFTLRQGVRWSIRHSFPTATAPKRLLLVTTGNIADSDLLELVTRNIGVIEGAFEGADFVELSSTAVIIRGPAHGR